MLEYVPTDEILSGSDPDCWLSDFLKLTWESPFTTLKKFYTIQISTYLLPIWTVDVRLWPLSTCRVLSKSDPEWGFPNMSKLTDLKSPFNVIFVNSSDVVHMICWRSTTFENHSHSILGLVIVKVAVRYNRYSNIVKYYYSTFSKVCASSSAFITFENVFNVFRKYVDRSCLPYLSVCLSVSTLALTIFD